MRLIHYLEIENFKHVGERQRIELDHPAVLIGPNNCGKTTAIQALALWSQAVRTWFEAKGKMSGLETEEPILQPGRIDVLLGQGADGAGASQPVPPGVPGRTGRLAADRRADGAAVLGPPGRADEDRARRHRSLLPAGERARAAGCRLGGAGPSADASAPRLPPFTSAQRVADRRTGRPPGDPPAEAGLRVAAGDGGAERIAGRAGDAFGGAARRGARSQPDAPAGRAGGGSGRAAGRSERAPALRRGALRPGRRVRLRPLRRRPDRSRPAAGLGAPARPPRGGDVGATDQRVPRPGQPPGPPSWTRSWSASRAVSV